MNITLRYKLNKYVIKVYIYFGKRICALLTSLCPCKSIILPARIMNKM